MLVWINFQGGFPSQFRKRSLSRLDSFSTRFFPFVEETTCRRSDGEEEYSLLCEMLPPYFQPQFPSPDDCDMDRIRRVATEIEKVSSGVFSLQLDGVGSLVLSRGSSLVEEESTGQAFDERTVPKSVPASSLPLHLSLSKKAWSTLLDLDAPLSSLLETCLSKRADVVLTCTNPVCLGEHGVVGGDEAWEGCCDSFLLSSRRLPPNPPHTKPKTDPFHTLVSTFPLLGEGGATTATIGPKGSFVRRKERIGERVYSLIVTSEEKRHAFCLTTDPEETEDVSLSSCLEGRFPPLGSDSKVLRRRSSFARVPSFRLLHPAPKEVPESATTKVATPSLPTDPQTPQTQTTEPTHSSVGCQTESQTRKDASTQTPSLRSLAQPPPPPPPSRQPPSQPLVTESMTSRPEPPKVQTSESSQPKVSTPRRRETKGVSERHTINLLEARR